MVLTYVHFLRYGLAQRKESAEQDAHRFHTIGVFTPLGYQLCLLCLLRFIFVSCHERHVLRLPIWVM